MFQHMHLLVTIYPVLLCIHVFLMDLSTHAVCSISQGPLHMHPCAHPRPHMYACVPEITTSLASESKEILGPEKKVL